MTAFKGVKISEFQNAFSTDVIKITATLESVGGTALLGDLGNLDIFDWAPVGETVDTEAEKFNYKLYYYDASSGTAPYSTKTSTPNYQPAFTLDESGKAVLVAGASLDNLYYANLAAIPILDITDLIDESIQRISILNVLSTIGIVDLDATSEPGTLEAIMKQLFEGETVASMMKENPLDKISLDLFVQKDKLGGFGELEIFNWEPVGETVDPAAEGFNYKLYYWYNADSTETEENKKYQPAFTSDEKGDVQLAEGASLDNLYYANLYALPFTDFTSLFTDSFGRLKLIDIMSDLGGGEFTEDGLITKILGDYTINSIGSFSLDNVYVKDIVGDGTLLQTLCDAITVSEGEEPPTEDTLTFGHLTGSLDIGNIKLSTVMTSTSPEFENILKDISGKTDFEDITVSDLTNLAPDNIKLSSVMGSLDNQTLKDVLCQATEKTTFEEIKISDLNTFDTAKIRLSSVMGDFTNDTLKSILCQMTKVDDFDDITVSSLTADFSTDNIKLSTVMTGTIDDKFKNVLCQMTGAENFEDITISTLSTNFHTENIKLSTVMTGTIDPTFKSILCQATHVDNFDDITVSSLNAFDTENIRVNSRHKS